MRKIAEFYEQCALNEIDAALEVRQNGLRNLEGSRWAAAQVYATLANAASIAEGNEFAEKKLG